MNKKFDKKCINNNNLSKKLSRKFENVLKIVKQKHQNFGAFVLQDNLDKNHVSKDNR